MQLPDMPLQPDAQEVPVPRNPLRYVMVGLVLLALVALPACADRAQQTPPQETAEEPSQEATPPQETTPAPEATPIEPPGEVEEVTELKSEDLVVGEGEEAEEGDTVTVHYTGWLTDGTQFDSSRGGQPFQFTIGQGRVIRGWEEGVPGMKVGGTRRLTIPPQLGYGAQGYPPVIPENATLVFDVELLDVQ